MNTQTVNAALERRIQNFMKMLIEKNTQYNNAALSPVSIFARHNALETIKVRIDDKLARLRNWFDDPKNAVTVESVFQNEDTITDLIGYLFLLQVGAEQMYAPDGPAMIDGRAHLIEGTKVLPMRVMDKINTPNVELHVHVSPDKVRQLHDTLNAVDPKPRRRRAKPQDVNEPHARGTARKKSARKKAVVRRRRT